MEPSRELEVELKLQVAHDDLDAVAALLTGSGARFASKATKAAYFDTPDGSLRGAGLSLRIRRSGKNRVQTVKTEGTGGGALFARPEWERVVVDDVSVLDEAPEPIRSLLPAKGLDTLAPVFSVDVTRRSAMVSEGAARLEVVLDKGVVRAGEREAEVAEVELELKEGPPAALFALARTIAAAIPIKLGVLTKSERGYRLLDGTADKPTRGVRGTILPNSSVGDAFQVIASACLKQFRLNEDLLLQTQDPDALHQARVALRRLRSALSIFRKVVADGSLAHLRAEARWLAATLGEARDIDVLIARNGHDDVLDHARRGAYAQVFEDLSSTRARTFMLELAEWLAMGAWRMAPADPAQVSQSAEAFASAMLDRLLRRLKKGGKRLRSLDDAARHEVRIEAKKLRYAAEFFEHLYPRPKAKRRARRFIGDMQELQGHLGDLNDMATAPLLMARFGIEAAPPAGDSRGKLIEASAEAFDDLMDRKPFWR